MLTIVACDPTAILLPVHEKTSHPTTIMPDANSTNSGLTVPAWSFLVPLFVLALLLVAATQRPDGRLHAWVLDVGQGDAILLRTPHGHTALIDGGSGATHLLNEMGEHLPFWQHDLDLMVLTHPHQDHLMGLIEVLERYHVDQVVQTEFTATQGLEGQWFYSLKSHNVPVHYPRRGDTVSFEGEPEMDLRVLSPLTPEAPRGKGNEEINNASIVLRLSYGKHDILLEGDAQDEAEVEMAALPEDDIASEILKVGHHGSDTSSTPQFINRVHPQVAIISVAADNKYGHPASETLRTLEAAGALVYRTDRNGTVEIIADKERMWVRSER